MPPKSKKQAASLGLEASLWAACDRLRSNMDAAEYKHVVLGLIFLKYVSDVFAQRQNQLAILVEDPKSDYYMPTEEARKSILESREQRGYNDQDIDPPPESGYEYEYGD